MRDGGETVVRDKAAFYAPLVSILLHCRAGQAESFLARNHSLTRGTVTAEDPVLEARLIEGELPWRGRP
jgi:hypothetical protein